MKLNSSVADLTPHFIITKFKTMVNSSSEISINALNLIFDSNQKKLVKFFWSFVLLCSLSGFCFYLYAAFVKWHKNPEVVMDSREKNSKDFPFPAFTICSPLFARDNLSNFMKMFDSYTERRKLNVTKSECEYLVANTNWCYADQQSIANLIEFHCKDFIESIKNISVLEMIDKSASDVDSLFKKNINMRTLRRIFSSDGICYTDNLQV